MLRLDFVSVLDRSYPSARVAYWPALLHFVTLRRGLRPAATRSPAPGAPALANAAAFEDAACHLNLVGIDRETAIGRPWADEHAQPAAAHHPALLDASSAGHSGHHRAAGAD